MSLKKNNIKFVDIYRQNKIIEESYVKELRKKIIRSEFIEGSEVKRFEQNFSDFCNKKYTISLNSGTDALKLALRALDIGDGDEVITVPNSYFSTASTISELGATPIFVDIDPVYYTIDVENIEKSISSRTRAIIPVHMYGQMADMDKIMKIAKKYDLNVIEDCAHSPGSKYKNKIAPFGDVGAFSFYPGKNLGAWGDAGAIVTSNESIANKLFFLKNDGSVEKYVHDYLGYKSRMDEVQALALNLKLTYLERWNTERRLIAQQYLKNLAGIRNIHLPKEASYAYHVYHLFVIEVEKRDELRKFLLKKGIETIIHYPIPIHMQKPYLKDYGNGLFPITESKSKKILSLPIFPGMKEFEVDFICDQIIRFK